MSRFVKLTNAFRPTPVWVNLDIAKEITRLPAVDNDRQGRAPERTEIWFGGYGDDREASSVVETPEQILAAGDPENACPNPERCSYPEYLAYRKDGQDDLGHGVYHAAEKLAEQHAQSCRVYESGRDCPACQRHEERLRA